MRYHFTRFLKTVFFILYLLNLSACTHLVHVQNYSQAEQPRYARIGKHSGDDDESKPLMIVSYNIELSRKIKKAAALLSQDHYLKQADIICLQEMTKEGVESLADQLHFDYIYYPSAIHPANQKEFGNAILSRLPIVHDRKIILPLAQEDKLYRIQRIGVEAQIQKGDGTFSVISTHLGAMLTPENRRIQVKALLDDLHTKQKHVIIVGDFNTYSKNHLDPILKLMSQRGFTFATPNVTWTYKYWYFFNKKSILDLAFIKGFTLVDSGSIIDRSASDHLPIWIKVALPQ